MLTIYPSEDVSLPLVFKVGGFEAVPDDGVVSWKLYRGGTQVDTGVTATGATHLTVPGTFHGLVDQASQVMILRLSFQVEGTPRQTMVSYRVVEPLPLYYGPEDVRQALGVTPEELPDDHIDLYQGYLQVQRDLGLDPFAATTNLELCNRLVCLAESRRQLGSLQNKMLAVYATDDQRQERFKKLDLAGLAEHLAAEYFSLLSDLGYSIPADPLVLAVARPDFIIGEG